MHHTITLNKVSMTTQCKYCNSNLKYVFIDLGEQPLCNNNIPFSEKEVEENKYPLQTYICESCFLVQVNHDISPKIIYDNYTYFSSYSSSWLNHIKNYCVNVIERFDLNEKSFVVEIASNDGYLLKNFVENNIPCLGVEPSHTVAEEAEKNNVPTLSEFFSSKISHKIKKEYNKADLIIANNVFAHVPNINDFTLGVKNLLKKKGVFTIEFPYLIELINNKQFDTIYHEHFFYYSLYSVSKILNKHRLKIFDIERLNTHGGSLRLFVTHKENLKYEVKEIVHQIRNEEEKLGINNLEYYKKFSTEIKKMKQIFVKEINKLKKQNKTIAAYGAPGKGNTLLNYYGISKDVIDFTVDRNPVKQNTFLPGSKIPVFEPEKIREEKPDYILILPWNIKDEIIKSLEYVKEWGGKFIIPIPEFKII